jgi:hypothetical protein
MAGDDKSAEPAWPEAFADAVRRAGEALGWQYRGADPGGLEFVDAAGVTQSIGLKKFFSRFRDLEPANWQAAVEEYLRTVAAVASGPTNDDLNAQADRVLVRLGQPYPDHPAIGVWSRPLPNTGLAVMLVVQDGPGLHFVRTDMVEASGRSGDEWYARGLENLRRATPSGALGVLEAQSGLLGCCVGDAHDGSRALFLESLLPEPAPHGVLASVPRRDALLVLPLSRKALAQRSLALLKVFTQNQHAEASHPISADIFWVRDGVWRPFGIEIGPDGLKVQPPAEMKDVLDALLAGEK